MNCNPKIHNEMITMKYIQYLFYDQQLQKSSTKHKPCCYKQSIINDNGAKICKRCGTVNGYQIAKIYINFNENKYKVVKKSICERKYHLENTINGISSKCKYIYLLMIE